MCGISVSVVLVLRRAATQRHRPSPVFVHTVAQEGSHVNAKDGKGDEG